MSAPNYELSSAVARELKKATRGGYVVLTRGGRPVAFVLPTAIYDEEDIGYMTDPEFWKMIEERRNQPTVPLEEVLKEMDGREATEVKMSRKAVAKEATQHVPT